MILTVQKDKIREVIQADQNLLHGRLVGALVVNGQVCENPGHCAIGAMLFAGGMTNREIRDLNNEPTAWLQDGDDTARKAIDLLHEQYGINTDLAGDIAVGNDSGAEELPLAERQANILKAVDKLPDTCSTENDDLWPMNYYGE